MIVIQLSLSLLQTLIGSQASEIEIGPREALSIDRALVQLIFVLNFLDLSLKLMQLGLHFILPSHQLFHFFLHCI